MRAQRLTTTDLPGGDVSRMSGHWLLARIGKRVLRPGGLALTKRLLTSLAIDTSDDVVEFAPGLGTTARLILKRGPRSYVGLERDIKAMNWAARRLPRRPSVAVAPGAADKTNLPGASVSVVLGEAMLTMATPEQKGRIVAESFRILRPGGRYGIHELCMVPDQIEQDQRWKIEQALYPIFRVGARPLPAQEWKALLSGAGFHIVEIGYAPMHLLRLRRMIQDEGVVGALRMARNLLRDGEARQRVLEMRNVLERYGENLRGIFIVAQKGS
mgnify:CR=1 FL=1